MSVLQLQLVSTQLLNSRSLSLAVPGTYRVDGTCVKIRKFLPDVEVGFSLSANIGIIFVIIYCFFFLRFWHF